MDNLIEIYIDMLAQANHKLALLRDENEGLKLELKKIKAEEKGEIKIKTKEDEEIKINKEIKED